MLICEFATSFALQNGGCKVALAFIARIGEIIVVVSLHQFEDNPSVGYCHEAIPVA